MKKIVIEIEDDVYEELLNSKAKLAKKGYDAKIEAIAADMLSETIKLEKKLKSMQDSMGGLMDNLGGFNPNDLMESFTKMMSNTTKTSNEKKETQQTTKKSKQSDDDSDIEKLKKIYKK